MKLLIIASALISGCLVSGHDDGQAVHPASPAKVSYLCVGMEESKRFGSCIGCETDARNIDALMRNVYGYKGDLLISESATKSAVCQKLQEGLEATGEDGLFLFFYSGHGGQEYLGGKEPDGADRMDEYLCLYDYHMLDDEIWDMVSKCRGRVFMYFDACHSATMYRTVSSPVRPGVAVAMGIPEGGMVKSSGFTFKPERFVKARAMGEGQRNQIRLLCWSGCKELEYSYGGKKGGYMTISMLKAFKKGSSYGSLWKKVHDGVKSMEPTQNPVQTYVGGGFSPDMEAFR